MAAADTTLGHPHFCVVTVLLIFLVCQSTANGGFSAKLIHRESPNSPFYNHYKTPSKLKRPIFYQNSAQSQVRPDNGQYLMKLSIGNPRFDVYGIADTDSDLLWTQCAPCDGCYKQINPKFDPKQSSTYSDLSCDAQECKAIGTGTCSPQHTCSYSYAYGGGASTQGVLAKETITITSTSGEANSLKNIVFGCGHNNTGGFNENEMGIIGLGGGSLSLVSQLGPLVGGKKLSFCLVPFRTDPSVESKISFGEGSEVSGHGVVSTPLVSKADKTPYFVTVEGISVGDKLVPFSSSGKVSKGNMFMDTGTPPTLLPQDFYDRLVAEVKNQIPMAPIENYPSLGTQLCYNIKTNLEGPVLTVHFEGADVKLTPTQTFISPRDEVFCFSAQNVTSDGGIYGNFFQSNFLIGYDLEKMVASFKPTDCTKE
ncbi:unnamed protein product [Prunus armeniaca]|uniref:Peptidase A1 domain-containing protein n=1 Tax=Prunus armeniaca TaxID=36596 RepID=A0A6J5VCS1_PRUAR|nr:unnamed protein product [Prunus armeniaca]